MNPDPASLENLRDIAQPPPVSWWPPAPGWWVVSALLALAVVWLLRHAWHKWIANAYRRAALNELQSSTTIIETAEILKRTALVAYSRPDIAPLSGPRWCRWLEEAGGTPVPANVAEALTHGVFGDVDSVNVDEVNAFASNWIKNHDLQIDDPKGSNVL